MNYSDSLMKQLDELHLIRCSLLPGELLTFLDDAQAWTDLLDARSIAGTGVTSQESVPLTPPHLQIKLESVNTWFEVRVPHQYAGDLQTRKSGPTFSIKGENISRFEQERWQSIIDEKLNEIAGTEYVRGFLQVAIMINSLVLQISDISTLVIAPTSASSSRC